MTTPYWQSDDGRHVLFCGRAEDVLPTLEAGSVSLVLTDPPYMGVKAEAWDRQWPTRAAYLAWLRGLAMEWQRLMQPNGSLYCFASPQMAAHVEVMLGEVFEVLNHVVWVKHDGSGAGTGGHSKASQEALRSFFPQTERLIMCEQSGADSMALGESGYAAQCEQAHGLVFEPIRAYLKGEVLRAGLSTRHVAEAFQGKTGSRTVTGMAGHWLETVQWSLPTRENYTWLQALLSRNGRQPAPPFADFHPAESAFARFHVPPAPEFLRADYEFLRADYESLRADYKSLRRPFALSPGAPYTDVWTFATVQATPGKHPCEKPLPLLRHMIETSTRPDDLLLDCCAGSGSTLDAARQCGRRSIGIEADERWCARIVTRMSQGDLFTPASLPRATGPEQPRLL